MKKVILSDLQAAAIRGSGPGSLLQDTLPAFVWWRRSPFHRAAGLMLPLGSYAQPARTQPAPSTRPCLRLVTLPAACYGAKIPGKPVRHRRAVFRFAVGAPLRHARPQPHPPHECSAHLNIIDTLTLGSACAAGQSARAEAASDFPRKAVIKACLQSRILTPWCKLRSPANSVDNSWRAEYCHRRPACCSAADARRAGTGETMLLHYNMTRANQQKVAAQGAATEVPILSVLHRIGAAGSRIPHGRIRIRLAQRSQ